MRMEQLFYLCEVAKIGSINATSEKLHLTQQGLNSSLKMLEKEIGYPLFTTSHQGITLTKQGKIVVEHAQQILTILNNMSLSLKESCPSSLLSETIHVGTPPVVTEFFLPNAFQFITKQYPNISINLSEISPLAAIKAVQEKKLDLAIIGIQFTLLEKLSLTSVLKKDIQVIPLYQYKLSAAVSKQHPLAKYKSISIKTLLKYPILLSNNCPLEEDLNYLLLKLHGKPNIKYNTLSKEICLNILKDGAAVGFLPNLKHNNLSNHMIEGLKLIPIRDEDTIHTVCCIYNNTSPITPTMQTIIDNIVLLCK